MDVSVIIVSFNVRNYLLNCIRSVQQAAGGYKVEIIVVDNASEDQSADTVSSTFPEVKLHRNLINLGFGAACNQGASSATGRYLLFLNPDTLVDKSIFTVLVPFMDREPDTGITGCKVLNENGTLQLACRRSFPTFWVAFTRLSGLSHLFPDSRLFARYNLTYLDENHQADIDAVSGAFLMIRSSLFKQINGFDEDYFMYGEDLDICYRVKEAGYRVVYHPETSIVHFKGRSKSDRVDTKYFFYESMKIFAGKHGKGNPLFILFLNLAITFRYLLAAIRERIVPVMEGIADLAILLGVFEVISYFRHEKWFGYPDYAYPVIYVVLLFVQLAVYSSLGVYQVTSGKRRRLVVASVITWMVLSLAAYFSKDFAFSRLVLAGSFLSVTAFHLGYRELIRFSSRKQGIRRAVVMSGSGGIHSNPWFRLWATYRHQMVVSAILFREKDAENAKTWQDLTTFIRSESVTDVILDTSVMDFHEQVFWIQSCRDAGVELFLVSGGSLKETLVNDILRHPELTGVVYRVVKRVTDRLITWTENRGARIRTEGNRYLIGNPEVQRRSAVFPAVLTLNACFPELQTEEDRYLLTLFYNRFHSLAMDRQIYRQLTGMEKTDG